MYKQDNERKRAFISIIITISFLSILTLLYSSIPVLAQEINEEEEDDENGFGCCCGGFFVILLIGYGIPILMVIGFILFALLMVYVIVKVIKSAWKD